MESILGLLVALSPILLMVAVFYFLIIRPQNKREAQRKLEVSQLAPGAEVLLISGIYGEVSKIDGNKMTVKSGTSSIEVDVNAYQKLIKAAPEKK